MSISKHLKGIYGHIVGIPSRIADWVLLRGSDKAATAFLKRFPQPELSAADKQAIDAYWRQYGVQFKDYSWFQMYYGVTGKHDPRFIPDSIARFALFKYYNDIRAIPGWDDKNLYESFLPDIKFPKTFAHIYHDEIYDGEWKYYSPENLPLLSEKIFSELGDDKGNFIVQERLHQSDFMSQFCKSSVNIFRVITWRHQGEVKVLSTSIRFGLEGYFTDVCYIDGEEIVNVVGVEKDGTVKEQYGSFRGLTDITIDLHERISPNFDTIIAMAKKGHERLFPFGLVGWDITLDQDNTPYCIEFNVNAPGTILYQYANGPFGGDYNEELMAFLLDKENVKKYIPKKYRIK